MGFLSKIFGGGKEYPLLDPASAGAGRIEKFRPQLEAFVNKIDDRLEIVPYNDAVYVFIGKPPGMFGIAWFLLGDPSEHNLKTLMQKKGLPQRKINVLTEKLRTAYAENEQEPRHSATVGSKKVIVTPSDAFSEKVHHILHFLDE